MRVGLVGVSGAAIEPTVSSVYLCVQFQIAHVQDRLGMESEETISALVGDAGAEEGRPVDSKQLLQEIASLKEQVRTHESIPAVAGTPQHV